MPYRNPIHLLKDMSLTPHKGLGQNFLVDESILQRIVDCAEVTPQTHVLEIGAGLGSLTYFLAQVAQKVSAVEIDRHLLPVARKTLKGCENVELINADILEMDLRELALPDGYMVVANIPYYITSAIIRKLLTAPAKPARLVLTIQEEVAKRICAPAGKLSLLALSVQVFGEPKVVLNIPAGAFHPTPNVDSVTLRVDLYPQPRIPEEKLDLFFRISKAGFSQKRKMLRNTLSAGLHIPREEVNALLESVNIDSQRRAQTLSLDEWAKVVDIFLPGLKKQ